MTWPMPGDHLGPCPCGHRDAMCHRANAQRYCPPFPDEVAAAARASDSLTVGAPTNEKSPGAQG